MHKCLTTCFFVCVCLQREFDENEVDPYHGKQEKAAEPEAMDLPDELNLDEDGKDEEGGEGDGMFNIQTSDFFQIFFFYP